LPEKKFSHVSSSLLHQKVPDSGYKKGRTKGKKVLRERKHGASSCERQIKRAVRK